MNNIVHACTYVNPNHEKILKAVIQNPGAMASQLAVMLPEIPIRSIRRILNRLVSRRLIRTSKKLLVFGRGRPARRFYAVPTVANDPKLALSRPHEIPANATETVTERVTERVTENSPPENPDMTTYKARTRARHSYPEYSKAVKVSKYAPEGAKNFRTVTDPERSRSPESDPEEKISLEGEKVNQLFERVNKTSCLPVKRETAKKHIHFWICKFTATIEEIHDAWSEYINATWTNSPTWGGLHGGNSEFNFVHWLSLARARKRRTEPAPVDRNALLESQLADINKRLENPSLPNATREMLLSLQHDLAEEKDKRL